MKVLPLVIALGLGVIVESHAQTAQQLASEGQRAYMAADIATAKAKFEAALEADPGNPTATGYLRMIKAQEAKAGGTGGGVEKQLRSVVLPEVKFKDATFAEALEYLKQMAAKQSATVSFVVAADVNRDARVTLNLSNVPFFEALRYLCELGGAQFTIDRFAVVIKKA